MNLILVFSELKDPDKVVSRDGPNGVGYVNFVEEKFSYLNITNLTFLYPGSRSFLVNADQNKCRLINS